MRIYNALLAVSKGLKHQLVLDNLGVADPQTTRLLVVGPVWGSRPQPPGLGGKQRVWWAGAPQYEAGGLGGGKPPDY